MEIVTGAQMRALDAAAIEQAGIPSLVLMELAGVAVVREMSAAWTLAGKSVAVVCGKGNNGADGMVVARHLLRLGASPVVFLLTEEDVLSAEAAVQRSILAKVGVPVRNVSTAELLAQADPDLLRADILVDAIAGTGLTRPLEGHLKAAVELINSLPAKKVAIDIPSGLGSDQPIRLGRNVVADLTVTFDSPKVGAYFYPPRRDCGDLRVVDIGIPDSVRPVAAVTLRESRPGRFAEWLRPRKPESHKGSYGHLLVIAGSRGMTGAAALTASAAMAAGAGLVTVGCPRSTNDVLEVKLTEAMTIPLPETSQGSLSGEALSRLVEFSGRCQAVALGPGLGRHPETADLVGMLLERIAQPIVLDADGLNAISGRLDLIARRHSRHDAERFPLVLTPHPGEMATLLGVTVPDVQSDRLGTVRELARKLRVIVLLKGVQTIIANPEGEVLVNPTGNPSMAAGGSGDVLTGVIGALLARRVPAFEAAALGAYLHGAAGDRRARRTGAESLLASQLVDELPVTIGEISHSAGSPKSG